MELVERKDFGSPDDVMTFERGRIEILKMDDGVVGRFTFQPGWKWSVHEKPLVNTELCEVPHLLFVISGRIHVMMADGSGMDLGPGSVTYLPPGHDAWVIGDEPLIGMDCYGLTGRSKG